MSVLPSRRAESLRGSAGEDAGGPIPSQSGRVEKGEEILGLPGGLIVPDLHGVLRLRAQSGSPLEMTELKI